MDILADDQTFDDFPGFEPIEEGPDAERMAIMLRLGGNPKLIHSYEQIEEEASRWINGEAFQPEALPALAAAETDAIIERTYHCFLEDAESARAFVNKKYAFHDNWDVAKAVSNFEETARQALQAQRRDDTEPDAPIVAAALENAIDLAWSGLRNDITERLARFEQSIDDLRNLDGDELAELVQQTAIDSFGDIADALLALPPCPETASRGQKLGRIASQIVRGRMAIEKSEVVIHEIMVTNYLQKWKAPDPKRLIRDYVRDCMVQAAKQAFGSSDRPIQLSLGTNSESLDLFDTAQAADVMAGEADMITVPAMPTDYLKTQSEACLQILRETQLQLLEQFDAPRAARLAADKTSE